jgi:hypothetical protein
MMAMTTSNSTKVKPPNERFFGDFLRIGLWAGGWEGDWRGTR